MPIRFRCEHCQTLMSIATRKAGKQVQCPACDLDVLVPLEDQAEAVAAEMPPPVVSPPPVLPPPVLPPPVAAVVAAPPPAKPLEPAPPKSQVEARDRMEQEDRAVLPDDLFDFSDDEPAPPAEAAWSSDVVPVSAVDESMVFGAYEDPWVAEVQAAAAAGDKVELPPLRSRSEETPEAFTLPIRKGGIDDEMDLTPMVDVVFQLLIFFMVTASFALHKTIQTPSPDPDQKGATQNIQSLDDLEGVAILVRIDGQNAITIDDDPLPDDARVADALQSKMRTEQKSEIIITADSAAWHRTVVKVVDAANEVGMQKIRLATRSGPPE